MRSTDRRNRTCLIWFRVLCGLLCLSSAHAKTNIVTLSQLVNESDIIVYGHFKLDSAAGQSPSAVSFVPKATLKGEGIAVSESITFCNPSGENVPDLSKMQGALVVFATKKLECLGLSHGTRSIVRIEAGLAKTAAIEDQPEAQPVKSLLGRIRALISSHASAE